MQNVIMALILSSKGGAQEFENAHGPHRKVIREHHAQSFGRNMNEKSHLV